jgi:hypothetical protein
MLPVNFCGCGIRHLRESYISESLDEKARRELKLNWAHRVDDALSDTAFKPRLFTNKVCALQRFKLITTKTYGDYSSTKSLITCMELEREEVRMLNVSIAQTIIMNFPKS